MESFNLGKRRIISISGFTASGSIDISEWISENISAIDGSEVIYIKNFPNIESTLNLMGKNISSIEKSGKITVINIGPKTTYTVDASEVGLNEIILSYPPNNKIFLVDGFQNISVGLSSIFRILVVKNIKEIEHFSKAFTPNMVILNGDSAIHDESIIKWPESMQNILYSLKINFFQMHNEVFFNNPNFSGLKVNEQNREPLKP
ncbi:MAG: hypothetical protein ACYDAO_01695 [Thermoplasmataceae archaeon]